MSSRARRTTLLLVLATLAATALLALGLPQLRLSPGLPLPAVEQGRVLLDAPGAPSAGQVPVSKALLIILTGGVALLVLHALWRALRGLRLASLVPGFLRGLLVLGALCVAVQVVLLFARPGSPAPPEPPVPLPVPAARTPLGDPPPLVLWFTAGGLLLASAALAAWALRPKPPQRGVLDLVRLEAERARSALLAGDDPRGVILACYARMSAALAEDEGIERPGSMTAREFGDLLGSLGVPPSPVQELTRLFEAVRYGRWRASPADQERALECLGPIVDHCRAARREA